MSESPIPQAKTFEQLVRWAVDEAGGFCPSAERLARFARNPDAEELHDVCYHVEQAGCRLCRVELEELRGEEGT